VIGHVAGVPVEELLPVAALAVSAATVAGSRIATRLRRSGARGRRAEGAPMRDEPSRGDRWVRR
jgi:hypothetical protein